MVSPRKWKSDITFLSSYLDFCGFFVSLLIYSRKSRVRSVYIEYIALSYTELSVRSGRDLSLDTRLSEIV